MVFSHDASAFTCEPKLSSPLKYTDGFTRLWPTVGTALALVISIGLLGIAVRTLPIGTAYAIWVGIGTVGTVAIGIAVFGEPVTLFRSVSLLLIVLGIIGLKLSSLG